MAILRRRLSVIAILVIAAIGSTLAQSAEKVYVTKTGAKYHRAFCSSLSKSKIEMPLAEAAARYGPCMNCKPPVLAAANTAPLEAASPERVTSSPRAIQSGRCQATTKKGSQCSRKASAGSRFCWQHDR